MNRIVGDYFEIVEGDQIGPHEWDFGLSNKWPSPVYYKVSSAHPDGPEGLSHEYWQEGPPLRAGFVSSVDEAQKIIRDWTPDRRRTYLAKDPDYWEIYDWFLRRGWMTPGGRRKYRAAYNAFNDSGFAALFLTDQDFRHGITFDLLYQLKLYERGGYKYEKDRIRGRVSDNHDTIESAKEILSAPDVPKPVHDYFWSLVRENLDSALCWRDRVEAPGGSEG
jgi:hypothetical protein